MTPAASRPTYRNPVYDLPFADPFVLQTDSGWLAIGTGEVEGAFPTLVSDDFVHWRTAPSVLPRIEGWEDGSYWAPEIAFRDGAYFLYFSVGRGHEGHRLRVATCDRPEGPYRIVETPVLDPATAPFAIDAHPFQDAQGRWSLFYARDIVEGDRPGTSLVVAPLDDPLRIPTDFHLVARANHDWQLYERDRSMPQYGTALYQWHTLEGPFARLHEGKVVLFYSGGNFNNDTYGVDYLTADSVYGSYGDTNDGTGARVLRSIPGQVIGPGHNSVATGPDGGEFMVYHAWDQAMTGRYMCLDRLQWTADGPRCTPTTSVQEL